MTNRSFRFKSSSGPNLARTSLLVCVAFIIGLFVSDGCIFLNSGINSRNVVLMEGLESIFGCSSFYSGFAPISALF